MRRGDDRALASVVGALLVLSVLGISLLYVNAYYVPRQGAAMEVQTRADAQRSLTEVGARISGGPVPFVQEIPLKVTRSTPSLLDGVILSPARIDGRLTFDPNGAPLKVWYNTTLDANDTGAIDGQTRVDNGDGTMRVYILGQLSAGRPLGALNLTTGGAYLEPATYRLAGGAVIIHREGSTTLVSPPALQVGQLGSITSVSWRIPILSGTLGEVGGRDSAQVSLVPGPVARAGSGQLVRDTTIEIVTVGDLSAWRDALTAVVDCATCTVTTEPLPGDPTSGTVRAFVTSGAPGSSSVSVDYSAVRYALSLTERASG